MQIENGILKGLGTCRDENIVIPDNVIEILSLNPISIGKGVKIKSVYIPAKVAKIRFNAFGFVEKYIVDENNNHYKAIDDSLYSSNGLVFYRYAVSKNQKEYFVPNGVELIAFGACMHSRYLNNVWLPDGVKIIQPYAFDCIKSIRIPRTVKEIDKNAISGDYPSVKYDGTIAQFKKIKLQDDWCTGEIVFVDCVDGSFRIDRT